MARINPTVRTWVLTCAVAVFLVAVIGMAGGFEPRSTHAITVAPGEPVTITRWELSVDRCDVSVDEEGEGDLQVFLTATNLSSETLTTMSGAVGIALPGGERFGAAERLLSTTNLDEGGGFDPGFTVAARLRTDFEQPLWDPATIRVTLHREINSDGYLLDGRWGPGAAVAIVDLTCTVLVEDE